LISDVGERYRKCRLANYSADTDAQRDVVAQLRQYAEHVEEHVRGRDGQNVVLIGTVGTGKDHLLIGLAHTAGDKLVTGMAARTRTLSIRWTSGPRLFAEVRKSIDDDRDSPIDRLAKVDILILSDPLPPSGVLTPFQAETFYTLIDARYRECRPTWVMWHRARRWRRV
jgi:DNA replication protein DnaC